MSLTLHSRCVGDVTVVTCSGRIVAGEESKSLQVCLDRLLPETPHVLLHLGAVEFIDSGGLGLIARYLTRPQDQARNAEGLRGLSEDRRRAADYAAQVGVPAVRDRGRLDRGHPPGTEHRHPIENPDVLCVDESPDVLTYLRELLKEAGYRTLTAANIADALILLKATHPRIVVIGAELRAAERRPAEEFNSIASAGTVVELPAGFSGQDAGEAAQQVLQALRDGGRVVMRMPVALTAATVCARAFCSVLRRRAPITRSPRSSTPRTAATSPGCSRNSTGRILTPISTWT